MTANENAISKSIAPFRVLTFRLRTFTFSATSLKRY